MSSIVALTIFISSFIICHSFLSIQYYEVAGSNDKLASEQSLSQLGTRFEAEGGIISLPSIDCLGCEFRGIVEKLSESQYSIRGEVAVEGISSIIPVSVLGTLNIDGSMMLPS